jgi:hypothetical protein
MYTAYRYKEENELDVVSRVESMGPQSEAQASHLYSGDVFNLHFNP